jgi:hypothetical protein
MHQFDSYIKSILNNINISRQQRSEMEEEFKDHLEGLKSEYLEKGMEEDIAISKAMEDFGSYKDLNKRLNTTIHNYRTKPAFIFGVLYIVFVLLFCKISYTLLSPYLSTAVSVDKSSIFKCIKFISPTMIFDIIIISPIGYFIPIIFKRVKSLRHITIINFIILNISIILILLISRITLNELMSYSHKQVLILSGFYLVVETLLGSCLGYLMLRMISNKFLHISN